MLGPGYYRDLAIRIHPYSLWGWITAVAGFLLCVVAIIGPTILNLGIPFGLFYLGMLLGVWGWAVVLLVSWFGPSVKRRDVQATGNDTKIASLGSKVWDWMAAIFLTVWILMSALVLWAWAGITL